MLPFSMSDEDFVHPIHWGSLPPVCDLNPNVFETAKRYPCKFENCKRSFTHSQSRSRHYRQDHCYKPSKNEPTINLKNNVTVNLTDRNNEDSNTFRTGNPPTEQIKDAINLCQAIFNQENTLTAIALIKESRIVQDNAIEMR